MVKLKTVNYITTDDITELTGKYWGLYNFVEMAENSSYVALYCDDGSLEDLWEDYEREKQYEDQVTIDDFDGDEEEYKWHKDHCGMTRMKNDIELIEILRKMGVRDEILVYICW